MGMQNMDNSIVEMYSRGYIDREEAIMRSSNPTKMEKVLEEGGESVVLSGKRAAKVKA